MEGLKYITRGWYQKLGSRSKFSERRPKSAYWSCWRAPFDTLAHNFCFITSTTTC